MSSQKVSNAGALLQLSVKQTKPKPATQITASSSEKFVKASFSRSVKELVKEPDPEKLANAFKQQASLSVTFRNRHNIYDFTIGRLAVAKRFSLIEDILESHKHFEDITREGFAIRIINLYGKAGMFEHARKLFDELPQLKCVRTVKSFNTILKAGVLCKRFDDVCRMFRELPSDLSITVGRVSYNIIIHAHCEMGLLDEALLILDEMKDNGLRPDAVTLNTLLDAFYREKGFLAGEKIWASMVVHDVVPNARSYNLRLRAVLDDAGELSSAVRLFGSLEKEGVKPNVDTFNALIKGFCDQGDVKEAKKWYDRLLRNGDTPNRITFTTLVLRLCDSGDCELAFDLSKKMFNRQVVVDEALLQLVVDGLVKQSVVDKAEELVKLGRSNSFVQYNLTMPTDVKAAENEDHSI